MTIWTYDIEATEWDKPRCVVAVSEHGDVERHSGPQCLVQMDRVMRKARGQWVAHAGGIYDTLLMSQARGEPWKEVVMSGSAVLVAKDGGLKLRDSFRWWLAGLRKVGEYLERTDDEREARGEARRAPRGAWLKQDVDRQRIAELSDDEALAYCESDTRILLEGVRQAQEYLKERGAGTRWTAGASALALLEALEPASWRLLGRYQLTLEEAIAASACVRGARVESWVQGRVGPVYCYDLKSAYPASYADRMLCVGAEHIDDPASRPKLFRSGIYRCRWFWPHRNRIPPVLDQVTGAGAGWCEGWLVPDEVAALEAEGVTVRRIEGWAPRKLAPIGQVFARDLYAEKERGSFFGKVFLNSLHGKFSESPVKESWRSEYPREWYGPKPHLVGDYWRFLTVSVDKRGRVPRHIQPIAAAHILGRTRARLWQCIRAVLEAGGEVYYSDTDSVHCSLPPDRMPMTLGNALGQLAFEGGPYEAIYCGPKAYCLYDPSSGAVVKGALKGMPWGNLRDGLYDASAGAYRQARDKEEGSDLRREVFERAWSYGGVRILKEGIASWVQGLRLTDGWRRFALTRTLMPHDRAKTFRGVSSGDFLRPTPPTGDAAKVWAYLSPAEKMARARALPLDRDPYEIAPAEDVDEWADPV